MKSLLLTMGLVLSCNAFAQQGYLCKHGEVVRIIEVVYSTPGEQVPCKVVYTKSTGPRTLWSAKSQIGYCESKAEAFINKIQKEGFTCTVQSELQYDAVQDIEREGFYKSVPQIKTEPQVTPVPETKSEAQDKSVSEVKPKVRIIPVQEIKSEQLVKTKEVIYSQELFILK